MAVIYRNTCADRGKKEMTINEFKRWLKKLDVDKDGRISIKELAHAVRVSGGWFAKLMAKRQMRTADSNGDGYIEESEFNLLAEFAEKHFGFSVSQF